MNPAGQPIASAPPQNNPLYDADTREEIIFEGSPSQWMNLGKFMFCGFFGVVALVSLTSSEIPIGFSFGILAIAALYAVACYIDVRFTIYKVTTERIEFERGWISKRLGHVDLFRMKNVRLAIGILDRILGIGSVVITWRDTNDRVYALKGIYDARPLYDRLKKEAIRADRRRGVVHIES